jgi:hypothetical protein
MNPKLVCGVVLAAAAMGCGASFPPPNDQWAAAQADVGRAQAGGAPTNPDAKLHLQLAVEDLQTAKKLIGENNERATSLTDLARVEAQLALSQAKAAAAEDAARQAQSALQQVGSNTTTVIAVPAMNGTSTTTTSTTSTTSMGK